MYIYIVDEYSDSAKSLAALTAIERDVWGEVRKTHFSAGINKESLRVVESSAFHVSISCLPVQLHSILPEFILLK